MAGSEVELRPGGPARLLAFDGELLVALAARPLPPGTRVAVVEPGRASPLAEGKVASVARRPGGEAEVTVRLFAPERGARARLEALAGYQKNEPPR